MMKKSLWVALATFALVTSCSQDENVPVVGVGENPVEFSVYTPSKSRANEVTIQDVREKGEVHFCAHTEQGWSIDDVLHYRNTYWTVVRGENDYVLYWPLANGVEIPQIDFYACYKVDGTTLGNNDRDCKTLSFVTNEDATKQVDLLVDWQRVYPNKKDVIFNLQHALSKLEFVWAGAGNSVADGLTYKLEKLELLAKKAGDLDNTEGQFKWTPTGDVFAYELYDYTKNVPDGVDAESFFNPVETGGIPSMLLIPGQEISVKASYSIWQNGAVNAKKTIEKAIEVGNLTPKTSYAILLQPQNKAADTSEIHFNVILEGWTPYGGGVKVEL